MRHYNTQISSRMRQLFNFKGESQPDQVDDVIVPVAPVQPSSTIHFLAEATNATSATLLTTPTDRDFYITCAQLVTVRDAGATSVAQSLRCTVDGQTFYLAYIPSLSGAAVLGPVAISNTFNPPIKCDRGTTVIVTNSTNFPNIKTSGLVHGYLQES